MMKTPISDFLKKYSKKNAVRLHMPGHKGRCGNDEDITEIPGADELFSPGGIILESEDAASKLFGSGKTLYSAEGSTLSIRTMLYLIKQYAAKKGERPLVLAARNAHRSFIGAAALLDIDVEWLFSETGNLFSCELDFDALAKKLTTFSPTAVYITSPDYLGNLADIRRISEICKQHGVLLLVDNAHGAYLKFLEKSMHPIDLGADMCADSAHKTLPVLTGGAYLHISENAPQFFADNAKEAMAIFASTSPSYLILGSLDRANKTLSSSFSKNLTKTVSEVSHLREFFEARGIASVGNEPLKLTLSPKSFGYTGNELAELLMSRNIFCEASDDDFLVMMFSPHNKKRDFIRIKRAFSEISRKEVIGTLPPPILPTVAKMSPHAALFSVKERICTADACGRTFAGAALSCPPAIPILVYGEEITNEAICCMNYYGIKKCEVIAE